MLSCLRTVHPLCFHQLYPIFKYSGMLVMNSVQHYRQIISTPLHRRITTNLFIEHTRVNCCRRKSQINRRDQHEVVKETRAHINVCVVILTFISTAKAATADNGHDYNCTIIFTHQLSEQTQLKLWFQDSLYVRI